MSGEQRRRLATAAASAGYPGTLLAAIAQATLPGYTAGQQLGERQLAAVVDAVEVLAEAGLSAEQTRALLDAWRERAPQHWRERFWALVVRAACANAHHARQRGLVSSSLKARR